MATTHEFDKLLAAAQTEIQRDAPRIAKNLDLTADAQQLSEPEMVSMVQRNWSNPSWRQDFVNRQAPEDVIGLYLKAANITNPDGSLMTVSQYEKQVLQPWLQLGGDQSTNVAPPAPLSPHPALTGQPTPDVPPAPPTQNPNLLSHAAPVPSVAPSAAAPDTAPATQPLPITGGASAA